MNLPADLLQSAHPILYMIGGCQFAVIARASSFVSDEVSLA